MKKYLLSALLGVFGLFGAFSLAGFESESTINSCNFSRFSDGEAYLGYSTVYNISGTPNYYCFEYSPSSTLTPLNMDGTNIFQNEVYYNNNTVFCLQFGGSTAMGMNPENFYLYNENVDITLNSCYSSSSPITYNGGSAGTDGTNPDVSLGGQIIENGTSALSPIITSIFSVMGEFIPYVVYIGIGILLCTLGFTAIKWLMNWLSGKITKYFR